MRAVAVGIMSAMVVTALSGAALVVPASAAETHVVRVLDTSFSPSELTIRKGDTVRWEWESGVHTITSGESPDDEDAGARFEGVVNADNAVFEFTFEEGGTAPYFSRNAPDLKGTITILDATPVDRATWGKLKSLFENPS